MFVLPSGLLPWDPIKRIVKDVKTPNVYKY